MPEGLPTAEELMNKRSVRFFSLDTQAIQAAGYRFTEGILQKLVVLRPEWINIVLTEITEREILNHRKDSCVKSYSALEQAIKDVQRSCGANLSDELEQITKKNIIKNAEAKHSREIKEYLSRMNGKILPIAGNTLAENIFKLYFSQEAPFENRKEKKHEFPDAASLIVLENYAERLRTKAIIVSEDAGWSRYASRSKHLYCVKNIEEFASIFRNEGADADLVINKLLASISPNGGQRFFLKTALQDNLDNSGWEVNDIFSTNTSGVEATIHDRELTSFEICEAEDAYIWFVGEDRKVCVIELTVMATVNLEAEVTFNVFDTIDREDVNIGSQTINHTDEVEMRLFATCRGELLTTPPSEWKIELEVTSEDYWIDIGQVTYDPGWE